MAYCKKCGAYIPIGETECPACGYDPEAEARQAEEAKAKAEEEARRKKAADEAAEKERSWAQQEREREERQRAKWSQDPRQSQGYGGGAAQSQYASQRTGKNSTAGQYTSQRTGWAPPWQETQNHGASQSYYDQRNRAKAADSANNQNLSILSYLGPLFLIPLLTRPNDDFARYHANQGLILFLFNGLVSIAAGASGGLASLAGIFTIYCMIKGIGNVRKGKKEPLPFIGGLKLLK